MKKFFTYFLLAAYLLSFPQARQLLKIPNLVEHYISHTLKDKNTTVFSFIKMHYLDAPVKDADYHQDMKLPFKTTDYSTPVFSFQVPPKALEFNFAHNCLYHGVQHNFAYAEKFYPSVFLKIWQPPKV